MTSRPRVALATAAALGLAGAPACSRASAPDAARTGTASTSASTDGATRAEVHRVVSISPATTEALFAVGAGERVVGRSRYCDWPPEVAKLPVVGGIVDADFEAIVQLSPDLVIGGPGPASSALSDKLAPFGVPTWFPSIDSLADIDAMILGVGERTGHASDAHEVVDGPGGIRARIAAVEDAVAAERAPRVLFVVDVGPVVATGPKDFIDEMIRGAGGVNALAVGASWQTLGFERVVDLDPDVVVDASSANGGAIATRIRPDAPGWSQVRAVREGHVVALGDPRVLRPGPRVAEGLAVLARALHPRAAVPSW
jgi:iron complex transport system substrate-binding protein